MTAPVVARLVSGFCQFAMHSCCQGTAAGDRCGCACHAPAPAPVVFRPGQRTSPERDLAPQVDQHGLISVSVDVGGRLTGCNLPPSAAARFLRELADDLERCQR